MSDLTEILYGKFVPPESTSRRIVNMGFEEKDIVFPKTSFSKTQREIIKDFMSLTDGWVKAQDVAEAIGVHASNVRFHLNTLKQEGFLTKKYTKEGRLCFNLYQWNRDCPSTNDER